MPNANEGLMEILQKLDEDSLISLARTVTQKLKKSRSAEEAIQNIIKFSPDPVSILRRKLVTRDILFSYLEEANIKVRLPITKDELIDIIADYWKLPRFGAVLKKENDSSGSSNADLEARAKDKEESNVNVMAKEFAQWFYAMLNDNQCGREHFFSDAKLRLNMYSNSNCETTEVDGDVNVVTATLLQIRLRHNLHFNPNNSPDGIQGRMDPHGLVVVLTCGTVHVKDVCAGVFEQVFALARDPFSENNWKIKNTELNLRSKSDVFDLPRLCDSDLTGGLLTLPLE